jgi:hypothetical protein
MLSIASSPHAFDLFMRSHLMLFGPAMKVLLPIAAICALLVAADVLMNDGSALRSLNKQILMAGKSFGQQISRIVD